MISSTYRGTGKDATNRAAGDDEAEKPLYELASDDRDELFRHAERSSGSDEPGGAYDMAQGPTGVITNPLTLNRLDMSEYAASRKPERILGPNHIGDSGSNYGAPIGGKGRQGRQPSATMYGNKPDGIHQSPLTSRHRGSGFGEPAPGKANRMRRDSVAASVQSSGILSHGGASGVNNHFGADRSQFGRSSTASFMSLSRSVSKIMDKRSSHSRVFLSKYGEKQAKREFKKPESESSSSVVLKKKSKFISALRRADSRRVFASEQFDKSHDQLINQIKIEPKDMANYQIVERVTDTNNLLIYSNMQNSDIIYFNTMQSRFKQ